MRRSICILCMWGCSASPQPWTLAPPVQITVGPAVPGELVDITLVGIPRGAELEAAIAGSTGTTCDIELLGQCSQLTGLHVRGSTTSTSTTATVQVRLPPAVPIGMALSVQVAGRKGALERISPVLPAVAVSGAPSCGIVQSTIDSNCVGCHGITALGGLDLRSITDAIGTASATAPLDLIVPGDADNSYLVHKLEGTHGTVNGSGTAMPPSGPLPASTIADIRAWIDAGATCTDPTTQNFQCDPSQGPGPTPMRRLSREQYLASVDHAIELLGGQDLFWATRHALWSPTETLPEDDADRILARQDQTVSLTHTENWYLIAAGIGDQLPNVGLPCTTCVEDFITTTGARLLRRPLTADELVFYRDDVYATAPDHGAGIRDLVVVWLSSPWFTHQVEHGDPNIATGDPDTVALTAHELAARLSFHAWNQPPDDILWAAAEDGSLLDPTVYATQVDRLFDDVASQAPREQFFIDWLQLDEIPALHWQVGSPAFDHFRGSVDPVSDLHVRVRRDALDLLEWHVRAGSPLDAVWTQPANTVLDPEVATLYGLSNTWDGVSAPDPLTTGHGGLLTRPAFHVTGTPNTRPIHKGVLLRRRILCDNLGDPPADLGDPPHIDPAASQRTRTEQLTEIPGSVCESCHTQINGLGYVTEGFDALGRVRTQETVYGWDGSILATHPIDDAAVPQVELGEDHTVHGSQELEAELAASTRPDACVARFWFRHTWGRTEDDAVDGCALQEVEQRLTAGDSLDDALRATALSDSFRVRRLDEGVQP